MTHDVGGSLVLAAIAGLVLVAAAAYLALEWGDLGVGFDRGVMLGACTLPLMALLARMAGAGRPVGDRRSARRQSRRLNGIAIVIIVAVIVFAPLLGRNGLGGAVVGEVGALAAWFIAFTMLWLARKRRQGSTP